MEIRNIPIGEVADIKSGYAFKSDDYLDEGLRLVRIGNLDGRNLIFNGDNVCVSEKFQKEYADFLLEENDVLIAMSGATTGKLALVKKEDIPCVLNQRVGKFTVKDDKRLSSKYLFYFLSDTTIRGKILKASGGSAQPNISPTQLKEFQIPLPDLKAQQKIAGIFEQADAARQKRKQANQLTEQFLQSAFLEMFGDPVRNEKRWEIKRLEAVAETQIGPFGTQLHEEDYIENGIPLINPKHIVDGKVEIDFKKTITREKFETLSNYHLKTGDVIMGRRGEMGRCALISEKENGWLCGTGSLFIRPEKNLVSTYLIFVMSHPSFVRELENSAQGVTMMNLNLTIIDNLQIPIPPLPLQKKFATLVEQVEQLRVKQRESEKELENLFQSLMQRYFG